MPPTQRFGVGYHRDKYARAQIPIGLYVQLSAEQYCLEIMFRLQQITRSQKVNIR